jgi:hypothetical protein
MPGVSIDPVNTSSGGVEPFRYLELETDELARLVIPDYKPNDLDYQIAHVEWVHELKAPKIEGGVVVQEQKTRRNGSKFMADEMEFIGRSMCLGDDAVLSGAGKGLDVGNCPVCKASMELAIPALAPERRYAVPVIRIETTGKRSSTVQQPPSAKIYVLKLTWRQWDALVRNLSAIREMWGIDADKRVYLFQADIVVVCEDATFKRLRFDAPMRPARQKDPELKAYIGRLWGNPDNRPTPAQMQLACARPVDRTWLATDLEKVTDAYADAKAIASGEQRAHRGAPPSAAEIAEPGGDADLADGLADLDNLLGADTPVAADGLDTLDGLEVFMTDEQKAAHRVGGNGTKTAAVPAAVPADADVFGEDDLPGTVDAAAAGMDDDMFAEPAAPVPPAKAPAKAAAAKPAAQVPVLDEPAAPAEPEDYDALMAELDGV